MYYITEKEIMITLLEYGFEADYTTNAHFEKYGYLQTNSDPHKAFMKRAKQIFQDLTSLRKRKGHPRQYSYSNKASIEGFVPYESYRGGNNNSIDIELYELVLPAIVRAFRRTKKSMLNFSGIGWAFTIGFPMELEGKEEENFLEIMSRYTTDQQLNYCYSRHKREFRTKGANRAAALLKLLSNKGYIKLTKSHKVKKINGYPYEVSDTVIDEALLYRKKLLHVANIDIFSYTYPKDEECRKRVDTIDEAMYHRFGFHKIWNTFKVSLTDKCDKYFYTPSYYKEEEDSLDWNEKFYFLEIDDYALSLYDEYNSDLIIKLSNKYLDGIRKGDIKDRSFQATYLPWAKIMQYVIRFGVRDIEERFQKELNQLMYYKINNRLYCGFDKVSLPEYTPSENMNTEVIDYTAALEDTLEGFTPNLNKNYNK